MATIRHYKDLVCWQKALLLNIKVIEVTSDIRHYALKDQMERAALSIINNIAEGFGRKNPKERRRFFEFSSSSCNEVESMTYIMENIYTRNKDLILEIRSLTIEVLKMVRSLSLYLKDKH